MANLVCAIRIHQMLLDPLPRSWYIECVFVYNV